MPFITFISKNMLHVIFSWIILLLMIAVTLCQDLPKLNPLSLPLDLHVDSRAKILCVASSGDQPIDFQWMKNGVKINFGRIEQLDESTSSLTLQPLSLDDIGNYTCEASNSIGSDSVTAPLFITASPWWVIEPVDLKIRKGSNAMIQCKADGSPRVKVTWAKQPENHQLSSSLPSNIHVFENGSLSISKAQKSDNGIYNCIASNGIGTDLQKKVHLIVYEYPVVERIVDHVVVERGEKAHISCLARGDPPLTFTWKKGSKYLNEWYSNSDRISFLELPSSEHVQFTISISNTDLEDEGLYSCIAENEFGADQKEVRLLLVERPGAPQSVELVDIWSRSARLRWSTPDNGNSPILSYTVEYWTTPGGHWNVTVPSSSSSCILRDLKPHHKYTFHVWATNSIGHSAPSEEIHFSTAKEEPSAPPVDVKIEDLGSTYVRISWKSPPHDSWNGGLTGYYIGYKQSSSSSAPFTFNTVDEDSETRAYYYVLRGLKRAARYVLSVRAFNEVGSGPPSEEISFKTHNLEPVPRPSLLVQDIGSTYIQIKWVSDDDVKLSTSAYVIHYRKNGAKWNEILVPTPDQEVYTLTNLDSGAPYQIYVTSHGSTGISEPSEIATVRTSPEAIFHAASPTSAHAQPAVDDATQILYIIVPVAVATVIIVIVIVSACVYVNTKRPLPPLNNPYGDLPVSKNFSYMATAPRQRDIPITISGGNIINYGSPYSHVPLTRPERAEEEEPIYESVVGDTLHRIKQRCFDDDFKGGATVV